MYALGCLQVRKEIQKKLVQNYRRAGGEAIINILMTRKCIGDPRQITSENCFHFLLRACRTIALPLRFSRMKMSGKSKRETKCTLFITAKFTIFGVKCDSLFTKTNHSYFETLFYDKTSVKKEAKTAKAYQSMQYKISVCCLQVKRCHTVSQTSLSIAN